MQVAKLKNANASVIAITGTATLLSALLTAAAGENQELPDGLNAVILIPEDGDIRILADGNVPTASKGLLLKQGGQYKFVGLSVAKLQLIRTGSNNVAVGVQVGFSDQGETGYAATSAGSTQSAGADAESNTATAQYTSARMQGYNGSTWDRIRAGITGAVSAVTGFLNNLPFAQYVSSAATLTANQFTNLFTTVNGFLKMSFGDLLGGEDLTNNVMGIVRKPLAVSTYAPSRSVAVENDVDVSAKAAAGNVFACGGYNKNAAVRYFQIFNKASAPANPDVPVYSRAVKAGESFEIGEDIFGQSGQPFSTGIAWGWSTTSGTFTAATTTDHYGFVHYV